MLRAKRIVSCSIFLGALFAPMVVQAEVLPVSPPVSTIAGSGREGIADGFAGSAEFVYPAGLAYSKDGQTLYIADRGAQRIRILTSTNMVRTIAGSGAYITGIGVPGGYLDGPAVSAKFSNPVGIAVGPDGAVYIADTKNHAIRVLRHNVVSTLAGSPAQTGGIDGTLAQATFSDPRSLAFDHAGNLYVADFPNGVRRIATNGVVSTVVRGGAIASITIFNDTYNGNKECLLTASARNISEYNLATMELRSQIVMDPSFISPILMDGYPFLGPAFSIAAVDNFSYVYADPLFRTVRWMTVRPLVSERLFGQEPITNSGLFGGMMHDGPGPTASFALPVAVARASDGSVTVADAGARRIRRIGRFDETSPLEQNLTGELNGSAAPNQYRILLFGDSYVYGGAFPWKYSIGGLLEQHLHESPTAKKAHVYTMRRAGTWPPEMLNLIETYGKSDAADAVVMDLGWMMYATRGDISDAEFTTKLPAFIKRLKEVKQELADEKIPLYVLFYLRAWDYPSEMSYRMMPKEDGSNDLSVRDPGVIMRQYLLVKQELSAAGVDVIDPTDALRFYRVTPNAQPLFGLWDDHFTVKGADIVADTIAKRLLIEQPWSRTSLNSGR